ncbi:hypothetical protein HUN13_01205, partial [Acinetobacter seifertii]|nr:hypothetical protein [Acinetobacter seifertii]
MSNKVRELFPLFSDVDGTPLDAGFIFVGNKNTDPEQTPVQVYWDSDLTIPAAQPIRTRNGFAARDGKASRLYIPILEYSITIKNRNGTLVHNQPISDLP